MGEQRPKKELKPVFEYARELGYSKPGITGSDHWRFHHPKTGKSVTVAATPSDKGRFEVQAKADLRRNAPTQAVKVLREKLFDRSKGKRTRKLPGQLQEQFLDCLLASEPDGMTAPQIERKLSLGYPPNSALLSLERKGLAFRDTSERPHVWRAFKPVTLVATKPEPPGVVEPEREEPARPAPAPTLPAAPQQKESPPEPQGELVAEVLTEFRVKMVRDTEGRHWLVLPFTFGGP